MKNRKTNAVLLGILSAIFIFGFTSFFKATYDKFERATYDVRFLLRRYGATTEIKDIVIVDIDEKSLERLGRFQNWPRLYHSIIVDYINAGGASIIGFDILFSESDRIKDDIIKLFRKKKLKDEYSSAELVLENYTFDEDLAEVAEKWGNIYFAFHFPGGQKESGTNEALEKFSYTFSYPFLEHSNILLPIDVLTSVAKGIGSINFTPDPDGVIRSIPLFLSYNGKCFSTFGLQIAADRLKVEKGNINVSSRGYVLIKDLKIPIDKNGKMVINYRGTPRTFTTISYSDVFLERVPKEYFKDKIVLVGASAVGLGDTKPTPLARAFPGVEIHANVIHNILSGDFIVRNRIYVVFLIILALSIIISFISLFLRPIVSGFSMFFVILLFLGFAYLLFAYNNTWIEVVRPLYVIILSYVVTGAYRYVGLESDKRRVKKLFSRFVSGEIVSQLIKNPDKLTLGGERKELTVLFSDIRDFTSMSEKMPPEDVVSMLNEYFSVMTEIILRNRGTVDKFVGDGIMAVYGAPIHSNNHILQAIKTAIKMRDSMIELNKKWASSKSKGFKIGITINSGEMVVGFIGSQKRLEYTVIGDSVNISERLQSLCKKHNATIVISENTYKKIKDDVVAKDLGKIKLKGKEKKIRAYELVDINF